jgi:hypothetical protein
LLHPLGIVVKLLLRASKIFFIQKEMSDNEH